VWLGTLKGRKCNNDAHNRSIHQCQNFRTIEVDEFRLPGLVGTKENNVTAIGVGCNFEPSRGTPNHVDEPSVALEDTFTEAALSLSLLCHVLPSLLIRATTFTSIKKEDGRE